MQAILSRVQYDFGMSFVCVSVEFAFLFFLNLKRPLSEPGTSGNSRAKASSTKHLKKDDKINCRTFPLVGPDWP